MKIAASSNNRCVDRAISTIRYILGYETALPNNWDENTDDRGTSKTIDIVSDSFDRHKVLIWALEDTWDIKRRNDNLVYCGAEIKSGPEWDDYIFAFVYGNDIQGHMVIGWPCAFGDTQISLSIGIKINQ